MPAFELPYFTLIPIIGHETGHYVWRRKIQLDKHYFYNDFEKYITEKLIIPFGTLFSGLTENLIKHEIKERSSPIAKQLNLMYETIIIHIEELFCDAFASLTFGSSFFNSYYYICCPRISRIRPQSRPTSTTRASFIKYVLERAKLADSVDISDFIDEDDTPDDRQKTIDYIIEICTKYFFEKIYIIAYDYCKNNNLIFNNRGFQEKGFSFIFNGWPVDNMSLTELSHACGIIASSIDNWPSINIDMNFLEKFKILNNIFFKSCELAEIRARLHQDET